MGTASQPEPVLGRNQMNLARMVQTVRVLRFPNGKFLGEWQYSQGMLDHQEVATPWAAYDFDAPRTNLDFAKKCFKDAVECEVKLVAEIKRVEIPGGTGPHDGSPADRPQTL